MWKSLLLSALLSLKLAPNGFQPPHTTVTVTVSIPSDAANRGITVELFSEDYSSSSQRELEGANAPTKINFKFVNLREGRYEVWAHLQRWEDGHWKIVDAKAKESLEIR